MAQYCRYCSNLVVGDFAYCTTKKKEVPEHLAKTTNYCPMYDLNPIDAFGEMKKGISQGVKRMLCSSVRGKWIYHSFLARQQGNKRKGIKDGKYSRSSSVYGLRGDLQGVQSGKE